MIYRVNAGHIPADSWIQDKEIGGGGSLERSVILLISLHI